MCGILGIYSISKRVDENLLIRMRDTMYHRGPDDAGIYISNNGKVGLGQRRLSILDLSSAGKQPMCDDSGRIWITYNGEVYNFMELRQELEKKGYVFRSQCDTEVLISLYKEYGRDFVHKLRGMFAFGIWDEDKQELFLVRDRIGIKPLYYTSCNGRFIFASEIKAILEDPDVEREVDMDAFYHYLTFLTTPAPSTLFKGISKIPAGHSLTVDKNGNVKDAEYWDVFDNVTPLLDKPESFYTENILSNFKESVKYRMVSDVPVGIFLSGGVDSSTNTALFSELSSGKTVKTFSIGFKEQEAYNEFQYARQIAELFQTDHYEVIIDVNDLVEFLPKLVYHQDEPIADPVCVPVYFVSKLARDNGVIVCQVGEGADELFCGYPYWKRILKINNDLAPYLRMLPSFVRKIGLMSLKMAGESRAGHYEMLRKIHENESIFWGSIGFRQSEKRQILSQDLRKSFADRSSYEITKFHYDRFLERSPTQDYLHFMSYMDLKFRLPDLLLSRVDKMSMATSLEARVPFLDHNFVEFAMGIPQSVKFKNNELKYIMKKSVESILPHEIIYRKKQGFGVPVIEWFLDRLGEFTNKKLTDFAERTNFFDKKSIDAMLAHGKGSQNLWYILNFVLWHELWIENIK